jgi:uncharacterized membrane protein YdbT with pleckstrin-like domain
VKLLKIMILLCVVLALYQWINSSGGSVGFVELFPFSRTGNHGFSYNWAAAGLIVLFIWGLTQILKKR